jgi:hypothetical protein
MTFVEYFSYITLALRRRDMPMNKMKQITFNNTAPSHK